MVRDVSAGGRMSSYLELVKQAALEAKVESVVFSDSIILTSAERDNQESSFLNIVQACSLMFGRLLQVEIPLRGAIAFGNIFKHDIEQPTKSVFIAGGPIVEAYEFERAQDWVGIMLAPSVLKQLPELENRCLLLPGKQKQLLKNVQWGGHIQRCDRIPLHADGDGARSYDGFAVVPTVTQLHNSLVQDDDLSRIVEQLKRLRFLAPSPGEQRKYAETTNWLNAVRSTFNKVRGVLPKPRDLGEKMLPAAKI